MTLWIILTVMAVLAAVAIAIPLIRRHDAHAAEGEAVIAVLRDQLVEVDGQVARGAVTAPEAEALRLEIKRRLLEAGRTPDAAARPLPAATRSRLAFGGAAAVALAATGLYAYLGRPDLAGGGQAAPAQVAQAAPAPAPPESAEIAALITGLEAKVAASPNDPEGWRMLGWSHYQTGRFAESVRAYERAVALQPSGSGYASALGEAQVQAAGGIVTPAAEARFAQAKALDGTDARARYFLAVAKEQRGERRAAIDDWLALLAEAPPGAPWAPELRRVVADSARAAGIDVTARLAALGTAAPAPSAASPSGPAPSAEQVAAVQALPAADQQAMIRGMVDGLAARLAGNPNDAAGWQRLIRSRMMLGEAPAAAAALQTARATFAGDPAEVARLTTAARQLGVPGA